MAAMRVLHISRHYHPAVGGTENVIAGLAKAHAALGIESTVLVTDRRRTGPGPAPLVPVIEVPVVGSDRFPIPRGGFRAVLRAFRDADVIHLHDVRFLFETSLVLAWLLRRPLLVGTHGLMFHTDVLAGTKRWLWRNYYARALRHVDQVIADSERDADLCRAAGVVDNLTMIHNAVETASFLRADTSVEREPGRLLTFGRIAPEKSLERLGPILGAAPDGWRLRIAGGGDPRHVAEVRDGFASFGDRVRLLGYQQEDTLVDELARCACVVLPSRQEAFGLTLVEAMASGAPIVASDIPAFRELSDGTGVTLVDFDDPGAVIRAIERAGDDHDPAAQRARAASLSWTTTGDTYRRVYERVVSDRRRPAAGWRRVLGVDVQALGLDGVLAAVDREMSERTSVPGGAAIIAHHNLHSAAVHRRDRALRRFYARADHVFIDGMPLAWFGRLTGQGLRSEHRITYVDLIDPLLDLAEARGWATMIVAGTQESVDRGGAALRARHPRLRLTVRSGHFDATPGSPDNEGVLAEIASAAPDLLLVGMGVPRQEHWIDANFERIQASVVMNMGGLLDYVAGTKPTPPRWLARRGFEWAARLGAEPRRLAHRYLVEPWRLVPVAIAELVGAAARRSIGGRRR